MPISNPIITINVAESPPPLTILQTRDPDITPEVAGSFWLNTTSDRLFIARAANAVTDWIPVRGGNIGGDDIATILGAIVVGDGDVLTDGSNVIFED
jgi:hypothetical protein